jgi:diguanylate cyclase (GGDEF)-like protein/putative nucleotidyltransferase with HDIG domain
LRWVLVRGTVVRNSSGKAIRIAGSSTDISKRKEAETQLKKALEELRFALASEKILMEELDRKNKELIELSITDGLTSLYNHRFLQERFNFEFKRIQRYGGALSCLILDIDHFKRVNDTFGHQFGDYVIRQIASIMKTRSREVDICGRYGGEEFMVLTNLTGTNALKYAAKLHSAIESYIFTCNKKNVRITVSIGIAEYQKDIKTKQEMIERSDIALYQAKKDGRNLIRLWKKVDNQDNESIAVNEIKELKHKFHDLSNKMRNTYMESINALIKAVDAKDPLACEHSRNVSANSVEIAKYLNLSESDIEIIRCAALLHDIGKISIRDQILIKKEPLTSKEMEILKRHPEIGVSILKELKFLEKEIPIILYHHERYDGKGYPHGLKGREIPLGACIIAAADAFDAMICGRTYKKRISLEKACKEIKNGCATQFSPDVGEALLQLIKIGRITKFVKRK